jgi:LmbE family N-acetylglucosaminyl deacetylase
MTTPSSPAWQARYDAWLRYVRGLSSAVDSGSSLPLGPASEALLPPDSPPNGAKIVYCAPHPDDESLGGALAVRLRMESGAQVTNVAITLGGDVSQRARRLRELESACRALGFRLVVPFHPTGFDGVNPASRQRDPATWRRNVEALREIFDQEQPDIVFAPHAEDFNTTHIGTHDLVIEALGASVARRGLQTVFLIETEFWHQLFQPNLMVGVSAETVAAQLVAIAEHGGEMRRNPYHLLHPCRMMDNVRRGSEVVGGQGAPAQPFRFAELYHVRLMTGRELRDAAPGGRILPPGEPASLEWLRARFGGAGTP